jgi:GNAT superfamily N-acetyltransferase
MSARTGAASCVVRPGGPEDVEFLREMLYEAVHWAPENPAPKPPREELLADPGLSHYLDGWGREGDFSLIALDPAGDRKVGAAWYRLMPPEDPGYGFVDALTPEISLAVVPDRRGRGVGGTLLRALMDMARSEGFGALSLSVQRTNPAARLYERHGFVGLFEVDDSWTMRAELT